MLNALYWESINSNAIMVSERTAFFTGCIVSGNNNLTIARQQVVRQHHGLVIVPIGRPACRKLGMRQAPYTASPDLGFVEK